LFNQGRPEGNGPRDERRRAWPPGARMSSLPRHASPLNTLPTPNGVHFRSNGGRTVSVSNVKPQGRPEIVAEAIYIQMGQMLGTPMKSEADAWRVEQQGIPIRRYVLLVDRFDLAPDAVGSESTLRRRVKLSQSGAELSKRGSFKRQGKDRSKE